MKKFYRFENKKYYEVSAEVRDPKGRRISRKTKFTASGNRITNRVAADKVEFELKRQLAFIKEDTCLWTWEKWHDECLERMKYTHKKSTLMGYDGDIKKWLSEQWREREMTDFTKAQIHEFIFVKLPAELSPHRKKTMLKCLRRIFELAVEEGIIGKNPTKGINVKIPQKEQKVLSSKDAEKLLFEARRCGHRFYYLWAFALFTGMRNGEIYAIRHSDIDLESGLIHVNKQFTSKDGIHETKGNCNRVIPICNDLRTLLLELMNKGGCRETLWKWKDDHHGKKIEVVWDDLLLPRYKSWRSGRQATALKEFCRTLEITMVRFHDLRATFITNMLSRGVPLTVVMKIVGHGQMSTTDEYNRLAGVDVNGYTEKLGYHLPTDNQAGNVLKFARRTT